MKKDSYKFIIALLLISCAPISQQKYSRHKSTFVYNDSVDYCSKISALRKWKYISDSTPQDSNDAYFLSVISCFYKKIKGHNKDSLTTDTCSCRKRLESLAFEDDKISVYFKDNKNKESFIIFSPRDSFVLDGISKYTITDSCRVILQNRLP
jgi:hypothetical protein